MPQRLRIRGLKTLGLVDKGDDPEAELVLLKRRDDEEDDMAEPDERVGLFQRLVKAIGGELGVDADPVTDDDTPSEGGREDEGMEELQKQLEEAQARITELTAKLEAQAPEPEPEPEPVSDEVQKRLDEAEKRAQEAEERVAKLERDRRKDEFVAKAKDLALPGLGEDEADLLMKCADALGEDFAKLEEILGAAKEAIAKGKLFEEKGSGATYGSLDGELQSAVEEVRKSDPNLTVEQARAKVFEQNPDLFRRIIDNEKATGAE